MREGIFNNGRPPASRLVEALGRHADACLILAVVTFSLACQVPELREISSLGSAGEGSLATSGWAVLREGRLSPYTYLYEHALAGPLLLGLWYALTGGPHA